MHFDSRHGSPGAGKDRLSSLPAAGLGSNTQDLKLADALQAGSALNPSDEGLKQEADGLIRRESGRQRFWPQLDSDLRPAKAGSSEGSDPRRGRTKIRVSEPDLAAIKDPKERRRQERLAKTRATAAVSRERKRIAAEEMGAKATALQQQNSYLKSLLENKNLEKQLLARELHQMLQGQQTEPAIEPMSAPPPGSFSEAPQSPTRAPAQPKVQTGGAEPDQAACASQDPPQHGRSPLLCAGLDQLVEGDPPLDIKAALGPLGDCVPDPQRSQEVLLASWSHGELPSPRKQPGQDSGFRISGFTRMSSQDTRHSDTSHISRLKGGASTTASPGRGQHQGQLPGSLLPGLEGLLDEDPGPELLMPGLLPLHEAFRPQSSAPPGAVDMLFDSWSAEEQPDWGVHGQPLMRKPSSSLPIHLQTGPLEESDWGLHGQPLMRESSSSLPIHLQTDPLEGLARKGSASLPVICEGSDALPAQPSSLQFMPGVAVPSGPGIIVGVDGQWIRFKPGFDPLPYPAQPLDRSGHSRQPGQTEALSGWALPRVNKHGPHLNDRPEQAQLPAHSPVEPDQDPCLQWGMQPDQATQHSESYCSEDFQSADWFTDFPVFDEALLLDQQPGLAPSQLDQDITTYDQWVGSAAQDGQHLGQAPEAQLGMLQEPCKEQGFLSSSALD